MAMQFENNRMYVPDALRCACRYQKARGCRGFTWLGSLINIRDNL